MSKKLQLSIPIPCHENWDNMSAVEKGKFCGSCQKQVVDFTSMNDREIAQFFKKPTQRLSKGGSVCGRFMSNQLERDIAIPRKRIPWLKYFFQLSIPALFFSKASAQEQVGKIAVKRGDSSKVRLSNEMRTLGMVLPTCIKAAEEEKKTPLITKGEIKPVIIKTTINGKVVDENGEVIPYATIIIQPGKGVMTDEFGNFSIPLTSLTRDSILHISAVGYESLVLKVNKDDADESELNINLNRRVIILKESVTWLAGEVVIVGAVTAKRNNANSNKDTGISILNSVKNSNSSHFNIFPNPVFPGTNIHIAFKQKKTGVYLLQFLNKSGQLIKQQELILDTDTRTMNFNIPLVAAGNYFMVLTNKKSGKKYTEKLIIQ